MRFLHFASILGVSLFAAGTSTAWATTPAGLRTVAAVPRAEGVRDLGPASASSSVRISMLLNYHNEPELDALVEAQSDPASPIYHEFLSPAQFAARYSPTPAEYARAIASLQRAGFAIAGTYPNRTVVDALGTAAVADRYFATDIHRVMQAGVGERYANASKASVPADIADLVRGVTGLNSLRNLHTFVRRGTPSPAARAAASLFAPGLFGPDYGYGPLAFLTEYDLPTSATNGKGQSSGIAIDADFLDTDISSFLSYFNVKRTGTTKRVLVDGGPPIGLSDDSVETELDVETITSIAPATNVYVYEFPSFDNNGYVLDAYNKIVSDNKVATANSSFGGCETQFGDNSPQLYDAVALQGASLGITFHASSGDSGAYLCSDGEDLGVSAPASGPHFAAIGGTSLYIDPKTFAFLAEDGWSGSGGGTSVLFNAPSYQKGVKGIAGVGRDVPDVAFDANPGTGASFYYSPYGFTGPIGGTSLSSPIFGAGLAIVNQLEGGRQGFINPALYKAFTKYGYAGGASALYRDITVGNNGFFPAVPGYDEITGIGAVRFKAIAPVVK